MGNFLLSKMSFRNMFKKPATKMYPVVVPEYTSMTKGHIVIDIKACILCGLCQKRCPTGAIVVNKSEETWTIDPFDCVQCGSCVRVCPKQCLTMDRAYVPAAATMTTHTEKKPELTPEEKAAKEAADREKAERIAAARAARAAKDAAAKESSTGDSDI